MSLKEVSNWLRDRAWPTLVVKPKQSDAIAFEWPGGSAAKLDALEAAYNILKDELDAENDRMKVVESKLISISSIIPVAMTITVAIVTFLTSGRISQFTRTSIIIVGIVGGYVALQFLRASLAAVSGLGRRSYERLKLEDIVPEPNESKEKYLQRICVQMVKILITNREVINGKVSQLALGHESLKNALWSLLVLLLIILTIVATGQQP
jgi:hypothetical protein